MVTVMLHDGATAALAGTRFTDVRWYERVGSTNSTVAEMAAVGAPEGLVAVTDHQTAGRGRRGRSWEAPPGTSLLASVLLRPTLPLDRAHLAVTATALAAADACSDVAGFRPSLKWPNDLVVTVDGADRKLAGILADTLVDGPRLEAVVVGIGLNVNWPAPQLAHLPWATSVNQLVGHDVDRGDLLVALLRRLESRYDALGSSAGRKGTVSQYRRHCATIGRRVRVALRDELVVGTADDVDAAGRLVVELPDGEVRLVAAGDVVHLRDDAPPRAGSGGREQG